MRFVCQLTKDTQKLTVCIPTQNCADRLIQAIESVLPVADEIVVVDGGSSDNTKEVACSFDKVRYFHHPWPDNFAVHYNYAMDLASGDWILRLDSDEVIGVNMRKKIRDLIRSRRHDLYIFPRYWIVQTDPLRYVKSKKNYPDYHQRLFRNLPRYRYDPEAKIHLRFFPGSNGIGKKVKDAHIFHFDFVYNDRKAREEKIRVRNLSDPSSERTNATHYLFEDYRHTIKKCRGKLW